MVIPAAVPVDSVVGCEIDTVDVAGCDVGFDIEPMEEVVFEAVDGRGVTVGTCFEDVEGVDGSGDVGGAANDEAVVAGFITACNSCRVQGPFISGSCIS